MTSNEAWNKEVPDFFCPYCNKTLSGSISPDDLNAIPSKGDVTVCFGCLQTSEFTADMKLQKIDVTTLDIDVARSLNKLQVNLQHFKNDEHEKDKE